MLNIKDPEAHHLAKQLAALEHTSMTDAVTRALRAALEEHGRQRRLRRQVLTSLIDSAPEAVAGQSDRTGQSDQAAQSHRAGTSVFDELYDPETGLPR